MAARYTLKEKFYKELGGRKDLKSVVNALTETDFYSTLTRQTEEDYLDFLNDFEVNYAEMDGLQHELDGIFGDYPEVLKIGQTIRDRKDIQKYERVYAKFPSTVQYQIQTVQDYCMSKNGKWHFEFLYGDGYCQAFDLDRFMSASEKTHCGKLIGMMLCKLVEKGGDLLFYYKKGDGFRVNGFLVRGQKLYMATEGKVRELQYINAGSFPGSFTGRGSICEMPPLLLKTLGPGR